MKPIHSNFVLEELDANGNPILSGYYDENTLQNDSTTRYRYDGQMTMEEDVTYASGGGTVVDETRYLLGARGIERLEAQRMASPQSNDPLKTAKRSYPLYDGHGNMIATLGRTATGYTIANEKKYDVWGAVRDSQSPGSHVVNPNKQYCANLGHTFDGESDLIYMRARYYEPATGRFISEDRARDGNNWYGYCGGDPVNYIDESGNSRVQKALLSFAGTLLAVVGTSLILKGMVAAFWVATTPAELTAGVVMATKGLMYLAAGIACANLPGETTGITLFALDLAFGGLLAKVGAWASQLLTAGSLLKFTAASAVAFAVIAYSFVVLGFIVADMMGDVSGLIQHGD